MVVDTSALVAIALLEPDRAELLHCLNEAPHRLMSSVSLLETGMVLRGREGTQVLPVLYQLVDHLQVQIIPFDDTQARAAISAFSRFGKGMGHRAQLNFGDCAVYALAALRGEPVLATGKDFRSTDIEVVRIKK